MRTRFVVPLLAVVLLLATVGAWAAVDIEDYAPYQPASRCSPKPKAGTKVLARWIEKKYAGTDVSVARRHCGSGTSEHYEGRALDWMNNARRTKDRKRVRSFLTALFAADAEGNQAALARRMGVMYVIWNDHIYASYDEFTKRDYLSASCPRRRRCSQTLRHRDHVHISLTRPAGRGRTSWYAGRLP